MNVANTPQGTGPMTLEQGLASLKSKMEEKGVKSDDAVVVHPDHPEDEPEALETEGEEQLAEENTEAVSDDESEAEQEEPDNRPILLPDGSEITVEEARKGYLRQSEFTRKTQTLAQEREQLAAREQAAVQQLGGLYQQLASLQEQEPNWLQLAQDPNVDPKQLQAYQAQWQHKQSVMSQAQRVIQQQQAQAKQAAMAKTFEALNSGEYEPAWKDQKALTKGLEAVTNYVAENYPGLPQGLLEEIVWPEAIVMMDKARRFDELQKAKPKAALAVKGKPAPFKPGAKSTATPQSENLRLLTEAFNKNPSVDNAVRLQKARAALPRR